MTKTYAFHNGFVPTRNDRMEPKMSRYDINSNPALVRLMIENEKKVEEEASAKNPDALFLRFCNELRELGFEFEVSSQAVGFMPKHKETILPIAIRYYQQANGEEKPFFLSYFYYKGFEEVVPVLLEDFCSPDTPRLTREFIGERLRVIRSKKYIDDYLKIISTPEYGTGRFAVMDLVGKLKVEAAIPLFIEMLEDEKLRIPAICALGNYKKEELRPYFERFENDTNRYWRNYSRAALKKLDNKRDKKQAL